MRNGDVGWVEPREAHRLGAPQPRQLFPALPSGEGTGVRGSVARLSPSGQISNRDQPDEDGSAFRLIGIERSGEGEIRTPEPLAWLPVFKTGAIDHSATSPGALLQRNYVKKGGALKELGCTRAVQTHFGSRRYF